MSDTLVIMLLLAMLALGYAAGRIHEAIRRCTGCDY
jgi:hypothetical protein